MSHSILQDALEVVRFSEETIIEKVYQGSRFNRLLNPLTTIVVVGKGMGSFIRPTLFFFGYWSLFMLIIYLGTRFISISAIDLSGYRYFATLLAFVLVAFALPSSYITDGLTQTHVEAVLLRIRGYSSFSHAEIEALVHTLKEFQDRVLARVNAFQWMMAASWALATYLFSQYMNVAMKLLPNENPLQQLVDAGMSLVVFGVLSLLLLWAVFGYKRGADKTFRLSLLALRQLHLNTASTL